MLTEKAFKTCSKVKLGRNFYPIRDKKREAIIKQVSDVRGQVSLARVYLVP